MRAELTKMKGSLLPLIAIAVGTGFSLLTWLSVRGAIERLANERRVDMPWETAIVADTSVLATLTFPTLIIMITASMFYIEHRNDMWKQLRTTASRLGFLYVSKAAIVLALVAIAVASALGSAIVVIGLLPPETQRMFGSAATMRSSVIEASAELYVALIPVLVVQFLMSLRLKNVLYPIGVGLALTISNLLLSGLLSPRWLPYGYAGATVTRRFSAAAIARRNTTDQVVDTSYSAPSGFFGIASRGKRILIDQGHGNRHGLGTFEIPGTLRWMLGPADQAGVQVDGLYGPVSSTRLSEANLFVIAGATADVDRGGAFTDSELSMIVEWVRGGGSLLLMTDHPPFSKPVERLAMAFGVHFTNDVVLDPEAAPQGEASSGRILFTRERSAIAAHPITKDVDSVMSYTGQAVWRDGGNHVLLLRFSPAVRLATRTDMPVSARELSQLIAFQFGNGRVVVSGETGMFTAQRSLPRNEPVGVGDRRADNEQLAANIFAWLLSSCSSGGAC